MIIGFLKHKINGEEKLVKIILFDNLRKNYYLFLNKYIRRKNI